MKLVDVCDEMDVSGGKRSPNALASSYLSLMVRMAGRRLVAVAGAIAFGLFVAAPAAAATEPGSTESLRVSAGNARPTGEPFTFTVEGVADGAHRLYVYGGAGEYCPIEHVTEPPLEAVPKKWLSSTEGEALPSGPFVRTYNAIYEEPYVVCAYLYAPPARFPDAWQYGCFATYPSGEIIEPLECFMSIVEPWVILGAERSAREGVEKYELEQHERQLRERELRERELEAPAPPVKAEPDTESIAPKTRLCHVPALRGHTLSYVRRMLHLANCSLGKVTVRRRNARVYTQRPHAGSTLADETKVSVILGR
jgi:hypothetical protein